MRKLVVTENGRARELLCIGTMAVGRDPHCDISASDPLLSRRHAEFVTSPESVIVRDLRSRNGITVNGARVAEALLQDGDRVVIAGLTIELIEESTAELDTDAGVALQDTPPTPRRVGEADVALWPEELPSAPPPARPDVPRPLAPTRTAIEVAPLLAGEGTAGADAVSPTDAAPTGQSSLRIRAVPDPTLTASPRSTVLPADWAWRIRRIAVAFALVVYAVTALPLVLQYPSGHIVELLFAFAFTVVAGFIAALFVERVTEAALTDAAGRFDSGRGADEGSGGDR